MTLDWSSRRSRPCLESTRRDPEAHFLNATGLVRRFCAKAILLDQKSVVVTGTIEEVPERYRTTV